MAKGRLLGLQFEALFSGNLYDRIGRNGVDTAMALKKGCSKKATGFSWTPLPTSNSSSCPTR